MALFYKNSRYFKESPLIFPLILSCQYSRFLCLEKQWNMPDFHSFFKIYFVILMSNLNIRHCNSLYSSCSKSLELPLAMLYLSMADWLFCLSFPWIPLLSSYLALLKMSYIFFKELWYFYPFQISILSLISKDIA